MGKKIRDDHFSKGLPIYYMKNNWIVAEHPDGKIIKIKKIDEKAEDQQED